MKWVLEEGFKIFGVVILLVPVLKFLFMLTYLCDYVRARVSHSSDNEDLNEKHDDTYKDNKTCCRIYHYDNLDE